MNVRRPPLIDVGARAGALALDDNLHRPQIGSEYHVVGARAYEYLAVDKCLEGVPCHLRVIGGNDEGMPPVFPLEVFRLEKFAARHENAISVRDVDAAIEHWKWQPTPVFLPGESQGQGSLVGCRLWGRTESDIRRGGLRSWTAAGSPKTTAPAPVRHRTARP